MVFYVVRAVHKFDFRLVTNEQESHAVIQTHVFDKIDRRSECVTLPKLCISVAFSSVKDINSR